MHWAMFDVFNEYSLCFVGFYRQFRVQFRRSGRSSWREIRKIFTVSALYWIFSHNVIMCGGRSLSICLCPFVSVCLSVCVHLSVSLFVCLCLSVFLTPGNGNVPKRCNIWWNSRTHCHGRSCFWLHFLSF